MPTEIQSQDKRSQLLLSLCFPTYCRAPLLDQALRAALRQITPDVQGDVEVVVLDNASTDSTPEVVAGVQRDFPEVQMRSVRRPENLGPDGNFCDAPAQSHGEFVLLLSDDDVLLPGAVTKILSVLREHPDLDAVALNTRPFHHSPDEPTNGVFRVASDQYLRGRDAALEYLWAHITYLSCIAFRRETVLGQDYRAYYGTSLAQCYLFLDALAPGRGMLATQMPYVAQRAGNNSGFEFFEVFVTNYVAMIRHAETLGYSPRVVQQIVRRQMRFVCYGICIFKSKGAIGKIPPRYLDGLARLWRVYGPHPFLLLVIVPMLLLPAFVYRLLFDRLFTRFRAARVWWAGRSTRAASRPESELA